MHGLTDNALHWSFWPWGRLCMGPRYELLHGWQCHLATVQRTCRPGQLPSSVGLVRGSLALASSLHLGYAGLALKGLNRAEPRHERIDYQPG